MLAGRGSVRKPTPSPPPLLAVLYAHAQVPQLKDTENMSSPKGTIIRTVNGVVTVTTIGATAVAPVAALTIGSNYKHRGTKGGDDANGGYKLIRAGFYFCERPHKSDDCPHRAESSAPPAESTHIHRGLVKSVQGGLGTGMFASVGTGSAQTANVTAHRGVNRRQDHFWVEDSSATR